MNACLGNLPWMCWCCGRPGWGCAESSVSGSWGDSGTHCLTPWKLLCDDHWGKAQRTMFWINQVKMEKWCAHSGQFWVSLHLICADVWSCSHHGCLLQLSLRHKLPNKRQSPKTQVWHYTDNRTHLTDILGDGTKVWHLWCAGVFQDRPETRCPQIELLGPSIQLQAVIPAEPLMLNSVLFPICTFLEKKCQKNGRLCNLLQSVAVWGCILSSNHSFSSYTVQRVRQSRLKVWHDGHLLFLHTGDGYRPLERGQWKVRNVATVTSLCTDGPQLSGCVYTGACLGQCVRR